MTPRQQAIHNGEKTYYTGTPCRRGHAATRRTANHSCVECEHADLKRRYARAPLSQQERHRRRFAHLRRLYGLTEDQVILMLKDQDHECGICREPLTKGDSAHTTFNVDHNHSTNSVRGLLCGRCNVGLGYFRDNPAALELAAAYLRSHQ